MGQNIIEISSIDEFSNIIKDKKCIIDFWATWCNPCKQIMAVLDEIASTHSDLIFIKVNVEKFPEISSKYFVTNLPAVFLTKNSSIVEQLVGSVSKQKIISAIEKHFS